jgi:uncharacterized membrane protein (DUF4010 family)
MTRGSHLSAHGMMGTAVMFPPADISLKLAISIAIGMLIGLEREWSQKDMGTRTFAIVSIAGALSILASPAIALMTFAGVLVMVVLNGFRNLREGRPIETTTSAAVIITFVLGVLTGEGHHYTPVAAAIVITLLLSLKPALTHFAGGLLVTEVRGAVMLGLLAFVIYPILPNHTVDPWNLINPREAWLTVVVIAGIGFVNYVLLKIYSGRGLYYSAVLGGFVNSTATIAELSGSLKAQRDGATPLAIVIDLLTIVAMFVRNLLILAIFARTAIAIAVGPLGAMTLAAVGAIWSQHRRARVDIGSLELSSPLSLSKVFRFGLIFLAIEMVGSLGQRYLGHYGFLAVSVLGGLVSSASTAGAAATLAMHHQIDMHTAGVATVLTSMASALSNLPLIHHQVREWKITRTVGLLSLGLVVIGVVMMLALAGMGV